MRAVQGQTVCVPPQRLRAAKARARLHDLAVRATPQHAHRFEIVLTDGHRGHYRVGGGLGRVHVTAVHVVLARRAAGTAAAHWSSAGRQGQAQLAASVTYARS